MPGYYVPVSELRAYTEKAIAEKLTDQQVRDVEIGKAHVGIAMVHREKLDAPLPNSVAEHDLVSEVYHVTSGSATLVLGPDIADRQRRPATLRTVRELNGPGHTGSEIRSGVAYQIQTGDVVVIPAGTGHWFTKIDDHIDYLMVRIDPDKVDAAQGRGGVEGVPVEARQRSVTMKRVPVLLSLAPTLLLAAWAVEASSAQQAASSCESLTSLKLPETTIVSAQAVAAGEFTPPAGAGGARGGPPPAGTAGQEAARLPAFCRVAGTVAPEIHFEVWLPSPTGEKSWNGKFNGVGNGGLAGAISYGAMMRSLARGYATASTDTGHTNEPGKEAWALGHPERLVDFASRSIHMTARAAKRVIEAYYGRAARFSYFTGCSCGGGQGLSEAQRYPADYDGIVAGAPANFPTRMWPGELYPAWVTHRDAASLVPREKLPLVNDAALAACDTLDGVKDGVLEDPRHCRFDPSTLQCKGTDGPTCLTAAQVDSVGRIYQGLNDPSSGTVFWPGYEISSELGWPGHIFEPSGPR